MRARAEQGEARASQLADDVARQLTAKTAAGARRPRSLRADRAGAGSEAIPESNLREQEKRLAEQRRASDAAAQAARVEVAKEQAAKKEAQRVNSLVQQELAREREGKQKAETSARNALERLAQEREAGRPLNALPRTRGKTRENRQRKCAGSKSKHKAKEVPPAKATETEFDLPALEQDLGCITLPRDRTVPSDRSQALRSKRSYSSSKACARALCPQSPGSRSPRCRHS